LIKPENSPILSSSIQRCLKFTKKNITNSIFKNFIKNDFSKKPVTIQKEFIRLVSSQKNSDSFQNLIEIWKYFQQQLNEKKIEKDDTNEEKIEEENIEEENVKEEENINEENIEEFIEEDMENSYINVGPLNFINEGPPNFSNEGPPNFINEGPSNFRNFRNKLSNFRNEGPSNYRNEGPKIINSEKKNEMHKDALVVLIGEIIKYSNTEKEAFEIIKTIAHHEYEEVVLTLFNLNMNELSSETISKIFKLQIEVLSHKNKTIVRKVLDKISVEYGNHIDVSKIFFQYLTNFDNEKSFAFTSYYSIILKLIQCIKIDKNLLSQYLDLTKSFILDEKYKDIDIKYNKHKLYDRPIQNIVNFLLDNLKNIDNKTERINISKFVLENDKSSKYLITSITLLFNSINPTSKDFIENLNFIFKILSQLNKASFDFYIFNKININLFDLIKYDQNSKKEIFQKLFDSDDIYMLYISTFIFFQINWTEADKNDYIKKFRSHKEIFISNLF
jgi:hypothetical protein